MIQSMLILLHNSANGNAPTLNNAPQKSLARLDGGCRSLRDNASDFEKGSVSPRNSATTALNCDRWRLTESTALFYDGWELNAEADAQTGDVTVVYLHGADIDEIIARADVSNATAPNAIVYYIHDHLGSVRALSNASGNIVESYQYEAFGKPTVFDASGNVIARSAFGNRFMFTGCEYLGTIQLYDYRNRTYSPKWGRFIEVDPIRFEGRDLNLYRYVGNRADIWTDPEGLSPYKDIILGVLVIFAVDLYFRYRDAEKVSARAEEKWNGDPLQNAMRHCVWQCELTQKRGKAYAYLAGQAHELNSADDLDRQADLFNNQCGRALGANDEADCEAECEKLWNAGGLAKNE